MTASPLIFVWRDGSLWPASPRFAEFFEEGERYRMVPVNERSEKTHRHFHAAIHEAWLSLPEDLTNSTIKAPAGGFPSSEHFRKWLLVHCNYADEHTTVCESKASARRLAALARTLDGFAIISVSGCVVKIFTATSITKLRGAGEFQAMKEKVLGLAASMIGVKRGELQDNAGRSI